MVRIIDRRFDSKNKSAVNRQRFMRRFKQQIRKAVSEAIHGRSIRDLENGEQISIPARDLSEPSLHHGKGGVWEQVFPGNDQFSTGDRIKRPLGGGGDGAGKGKASQDGEHEDDGGLGLVAVLARDVGADGPRPCGGEQGDVGDGGQHHGPDECRV